MVRAISHLDRLADQFVTCVLPREEWTHAAHLAVGMWHIDRYGSDEALLRLRVGIRRLNDSHGTLNSPTSGYHETITHAYVQLLSEFIEACPVDMVPSARLAHLLGSPLADRHVLLKFYSQERLMSARARAEWLEPDLAPLRLTTVFEGQSQIPQGYGV